MATSRAVMNILICFPPNESTARWQSDLQQALPRATIQAWQAGSAWQADYAIVWQAPQQFFDEQTQLKAIFNAGAGVDALQALRLPAGVPLIRLVDAGMGAQMAQYVAHAVITYFREFDVYAKHAAKAQWSPRAPRHHSDYPIGIMGYGVLGQAIATALTALGFKVHAWARSEHAQAAVTVHVGDNGLAAFLSATRVLVCVLPLTPQTRGIVNQALLSQLKANAYFINVGRGGHVIEADLLSALDDGTLAGATLDVCQNEPAQSNHPFWQHPKVTLTPHIAATTLRQDAIAQIADKIIALSKHQAVSGVVDAARKY
jgi:glyoxylate/hydroxypyruvate reductase